MIASIAAVEQLLDHHHPHAVARGPLHVLAVVGGAADADLDDAAGVEEALLGGAAERRPVGVGEVAVVAVVEVGVGVEVDHADGPVPSPARAGPGARRGGRRRRSSA
jgi:hypothetical protein